MTWNEFMDLCKQGEAHNTAHEGCGHCPVWKPCGSLATELCRLPGDLIALGVEVEA